jgi:hypothetical protein
MCSLLFLIALSFISLIEADCGSWIPLDPKTVPKANPKDTIIVYNLVCALLECQFDSAMTYLNGYHGGIGFHNVNSNNSVSINFDAVPTFSGSILPDMVYLPNGDVELVWSNYGNVFIYQGINMTFWSYGTQAVANVSGTVFNSVIDWFVKYNSTDQFYDVWSVYTHYPLQPWDRSWIQARECFSFVWETFAYMSSLGVKFDVKSGRQSIITLLSPTAPIKLNMNNPAEKAMVVAFYQYLIDQLNKFGVASLLAVLRELLLEERMIIRSYGEYYLVQPWAPFIDTVFPSFPFPPYN